MLKTLFIIFLIVWLVPILIFLIVHFHNFRKAFAKARWWTVIWFVGILGILTEWIMFFPAWFTRKIPVVKWVFWIWMDDSRFKAVLKANELGYLKDVKVYADDYIIFLKGREETIWKAYAWHMRNRVWNLDSLFRPKKGKRVLYEMVVDRLYMAGKRVDQMAEWIPMARLKYWKNGKDGWDVNSGEFLSYNHSIFGKGYLWEKIGNRLTFRYSFVKLFLGRYLLFIAGENDKRNVFSIKWKKKKLLK